MRFDTYQPDPGEPSQAAAVGALQAFVARMDEPPRRGLLGRRRPRPPGRPGVYLDGGYGVGKTHLLASVWHAAPGPKSYTSFADLTALVGALGFAAAVVDALAGRRLLAIDEFELDDVGNTVLVSTLLRRLVDAGVRVAATSNTLPSDLGGGRFNADDFLREIQGLAAHFAPVRVEGQDYRHRGLEPTPPPRSEGDLDALGDRLPAAPYDDFPALLDHLAALHPTRYRARCSTACPRCCCAGWRRWPTRTWRCGWSCSPTGSTTGRCRWPRAGSGGTPCSTGAARRRLPREAPAGGVAAVRAGPPGRGPATRACAS